MWDVPLECLRKGQEGSGEVGLAVWVLADRWLSS